MGIAGTASSVFASMILSAKSGTHMYQRCCFSSDPRRTIRCPSQTEHHPLVRMKKEKLGTKRKSKTILTDIPPAQELKRIQTVPFSVASKLLFSALAGLFHLGVGEANKRVGVMSPTGRNNYEKEYK